MTRLNISKQEGHSRFATEYIEKYAHVAEALNAAGYAVASLDWRGQGLSERACDDPMKGHIDRFSEYQADIDALLALAR